MTETANTPSSVDRSDVWRGLRFVLIAVFVYSCLHVGFRLLASPVLGEDDVVDIVLVQDLRLAYDAFPRQPPLYNWVLWAVEAVVGPGIEAFLFIKYAALIATAGFLYLAAYRVLRDRLFAVLTVESLALIYQISWRFHEGFTHEVGAMVAVMATAWLVLRWFDQPNWLNALALGVVMGLGFLTEPPYAVFVLSLLIAALLQPGTRARLFDPRLLVSLLIGLTILSPYLWWLTQDATRMSYVNIHARGTWDDTFRGMKDALRGPIAYLSPLLFILPLVFPRYLPTAWRDLTRLPANTDEPDRVQFILHAGLSAWILSMAGAFFYGIRGLPVHVLMPLYLITVIWLFDVARRASGEPLYIGRFTRLALAIAVIAFGARMANMFVLDPVCKKCRWGIPYAGLGQEMRERGFDGGTIVSIDKELAGNLRPIFPDSKVIMRRYPQFTPAGADIQTGDVAYVWNANFTDAEVELYLKDLLPEGAKAADAETISVPWHHLWRDTGWRKTDWKLIVVDRDDAANGG